MSNQLNIGDMAPDFTLPGDGGTDISLGQYKGQNLILYFYPKDDTSGCTTEAIAFTQNLPKFSKLNASIVGVSKDSVKKHDKFKEKHALKIRLAANEDLDMIEAYGVWVEKSMYGRKYMGIERTTFLLDSDGKILHIWRKVKVKDHVEQVLEKLAELCK